MTENEDEIVLRCLKDFRRMIDINELSAYQELEFKKLTKKGYYFLDGMKKSNEALRWTVDEAIDIYERKVIK